MGRVLGRLTERTMYPQVQYVEVVRRRAAQGTVAAVYTQLMRDFGVLAPPLTLHSAAPECLAAAWALFRETTLAHGEASRAAKEAVAVAVSRDNSCPYCVDVHSMALHGLTDRRQAAAVATGAVADVADARLRALVDALRPDAIGEPAVPARQAPQLVGTAVAFHYLNRMANVFLAPSPVPEHAPDRIRRWVKRIGGPLVRPLVRRQPSPGAAPPLLPDAPPLRDAPWAAGDPVVADAAARAAAAAERAGARTVPEPVRRRLAELLADWDGSMPELGAPWLRTATVDLPASARPAGELAVRTAFASYQVGESVVGEFRRTAGTDRALLELTAWASMAAARRAGVLLDTVVAR